MSLGNRIRAGAAVVEVALDRSEFVQGLRGIETDIKRVGTNIAGLGAQVTGAGVAILGPLIGASRVFADFDDSVRALGAIATEQGVSIDQLRNKILQLGRDTSFTSKEVAEAAVNLARQGFDTGEIDNAIEDILNLSRATRTDLAESAQFAGTALRAFGLEAGDMTRVVDVMTATANNSATNVTDLSEALKLAADPARRAGLSIERTSEQIGLLANVGIRGSLAGNALKRAIEQLGNVKKRNLVEDVLGVRVADSTGGFRDLPTVFREIFTATQRLGTVRAQGVFTEIFGARASTAAPNIGGNIEAMNKLAVAIENTSDLAQTQAAAMDQGLGGAFRRLTSAANNFVIAIGEAVSGDFGTFSTVITDLIRSATEWVNANQGAIRSLAIIGATLVTVGGSITLFGGAIIAVGAVIGGVGTIISTIGTVVGLLGPVFAFLVGPIGLAVAAVGLAIVTFGVFGRQVTEAIGSILGFSDETIAAMESFRQSVISALAAIFGFDLLGDFASELIGDIRATLNSVGALIRQGDVESAFELLWARVQLIAVRQLRNIIRFFLTGIVQPIRIALNLFGAIPGLDIDSKPLDDFIKKQSQAVVGEEGFRKKVELTQEIIKRRQELAKRELETQEKQGKSEQAKLRFMRAQEDAAQKRVADQERANNLLQAEGRLRGAINKENRTFAQTNFRDPLARQLGDLQRQENIIKLRAEFQSNFGEEVTARAEAQFAATQDRLQQEINAAEAAGADGAVRKGQILRTFRQKAHEEAMSQIEQQNEAQEDALKARLKAIEKEKKENEKLRQEIARFNESFDPQVALDNRLQELQRIASSGIASPVALRAARAAAQETFRDATDEGVTDFNESNNARLQFGQEIRELSRIIGTGRGDAEAVRNAGVDSVTSLLDSIGGEFSDPRARLDAQIEELAKLKDFGIPADVFDAARDSVIQEFAEGGRGLFETIDREIKVAVTSSSVQAARTSAFVVGNEDDKQKEQLEQQKLIRIATQRTARALADIGTG